MGHWERPQLTPESPGQRSEPRLAPERVPSPPPLSPGHAHGEAASHGVLAKIPRAEGWAGGCGEAPQHPTLHGCPLKMGRAGPSQARGVTQRDPPDNGGASSPQTTPISSSGPGSVLRSPQSEGPGQHRALGGWSKGRRLMATSRAGHCLGERTPEQMREGRHQAQADQEHGRENSTPKATQQIHQGARI